MGKDVKENISNARLKKSQGNPIEPTSQRGEWYKVVDPITGAVKYLRKSEKKKKRKKRK